MASHRKSALSLPLLGQVLPPPPARLTPQIRRLDCTWWGCKSTHCEVSFWRLVSSQVNGRGFAEVAKCLENNQVLLPPILSCPWPSVPQGQAHSDIAWRPHLTTPPRMQVLSKAAGDSPRSPPAAASVETNHFLLINHLPQMCQECFFPPGAFLTSSFLTASLDSPGKQKQLLS